MQKIIKLKGGDSVNTDYYKKFEPVFNSWYIKRMLGEGSYGKVFEIEREDFGTTYKAALKAMTIPQSESEVKSVMADGMDEASVREYYENFVEDIVKEFVLMSKLKGNSNIVSYEDHVVVEHKDEIGWDILIRMELLTPLHDHIKSIDLKRKDVIQLGIDMCKALELCQKYNIIHRDIKPENIFVSENGDYKLGDFGIARTLEQTSGMLSKKGTQAYMAPEIYREESYGSNVDIYSLGIVMYRLLNENRTPFLPAYPAPITHSDREAAIKKRISGAPIPMPTNADGRLAEIVLKACSYDPKERYFSPMEMREELEAILYNKEEAKVIYPKGDETPIKSIRYIKTGDDIPEVDTEARTEDGLGNGKRDKSNRTEGMFGGRKNADSTSKTEGMFGRNKDDSDKTESGFESKIDYDEKTEGMFGKKVVSSTLKKSIWKNWITYAVGGVVAVGLCVGGFFLFSNPAAPTSYSVSSITELKEPIEMTISDQKIPQADYEIIVKRLNAYGADFYIDQNSGKLAMNKSDLGASNQEILATLHMITGEGKIKLDSPNGSENALGIDEIDKAIYSDNRKENCTYINIKLNDAGSEKIAKIDEEIQSSEQNHFIYLYVDDNLRCNDGLFDAADKEIIFEGGYDGKEYLASNPFVITAHAEQSEEAIKLSPNYIRLLVSIINDGKLSKNYEVIIDEKYGIVLETEPPVEEEPPVVETEEPIETSEPPVNNDNSYKKPSNNTKKTKEKSTGQQTQQQPAQKPAQQPVQQQPVQEQPAQQPVQQPAQQPSSNNANNLPEFYMDFD